MLGFGIRNTAHRIRNPSSHDEESGIQYLEYRIQGMGSRIQDCLRAPLHGAILCCVTLLTVKTILLVIQHIGHIHDLTPSLFILYLQRYEFHKILRRNGHS